jgi:hypothetical protein
MNIIPMTMPFINTYLEIERGMDKLAEKAKQKYWDACNYPRKKKKQMRKEAMIDYAIFSWKF